ncbi:hypothetical protein ABZ154_33575 [Streptomyces sp. NPDC006261]|uniref:hypothetical protein n=1 Tax=Streptomyces sp. NPDC006261 TaxID=3156739 RepID=UPI0033B9062A
MAKPGYGKRSVPSQPPRTREDFAFLPTRERYVAGFIDHLPEAAAMSVKTLAQQLPLDGQQAIGSALKALSVAGHLRRVRCELGREGQVRWVSPAYLALAHLGQVDRRVGLSAEDCDALEELAAAWLERGVTGEYVVHALTAGLPRSVDSPAGLVRRRLRRKIPPHQPTAGAAQPPAPGAPATPVLVECSECGAPGRPEALPDGLCRPCRPGAEGPEGRTRDDGLPVQRDIGAYVSSIRYRLKLP